MAAGRIIVGYAFPTIEEILVDGETALLANPGNYRELENKLAEALTIRYPSKMVQKARNLALVDYSWERRAQNILESISSN